MSNELRPTYGFGGRTDAGASSRTNLGGDSQGGPHASFARAPHGPAQFEAADLADDEPAELIRPRSVVRTEPRPELIAPSKPEYQLEARGLTKSFRKGGAEIPVLTGVSMGVRQGEFLAIVGQSGSGKSTLLHLLATLDAPDEGEVYFSGQRIDRLPGAQRDRVRNQHIGMIFQFYHLLPELTTLENVLTPVMIGRSVWQFFRHRKIYRKIAAELLEIVGLSHRLKHTPRELSGGEMQRAAIARALIPGPDLLLADEPTGNLDQRTGRDILEILCSLNRQQNLTIVMVTHDPAIAERADRVVRLVDGRVEEA